MPRVLPLCIIFPVLFPASAIDVLPKSEVDRLVAQLIVGQWCEGLVVALVRLDDSGKPQTQFHGYGRKTTKTHRRPTHEHV